jgi:hypothetical protein
MPRRLRNSVLNGWLKPIIAEVDHAFFQGSSAVFIEKTLSSRCIATSKVRIRNRKKA